MLVSAIMPTRGRPEFARKAIECFLAQDWPEKEMVIVDDEGEPSFNRPPRGVEYHLMGRRMTIGAKRNLAVSRAQGDVLIHFDDDDWSAPGRMRDQVQRLVESGLGITGYHSMIFEDELGRRWKYRGAANYALGTSLCYTREFWRRNPFPDVNSGEDNSIVYRNRVASVDAGDLMIARKHSGNTSIKGMNTSEWLRIS